MYRHYIVKFSTKYIISCKLLFISEHSAGSKENKDDALRHIKVMLNRGIADSCYIEYIEAAED